MTLRVSREFLRTAREMVDPEGADDAVIDHKVTGRVGYVTVSFNLPSHALEFLYVLGFMTSDDASAESNELLISADDGRDLVQRATVTSTRREPALSFYDVELED